MSTLESIFLILSLIAVALTIVSAVAAFIIGRRTARVKTRKVVSTLTRIINALAFVCITATIVFRTMQTGHGPFSNMYEFALAFSWGILAMGWFFEWRFNTSAAKNVGLIIALFMLIFATVQHAKPEPLIPALQQSVLLSVHVAAAVVAYGTFAVAFGAAVMYLFQRHGSVNWMPPRDTLEEVGYRAVVIGFPMLVLVLVLGAVWANTAWGRYWDWDPKETATLLTTLIYAGYLHAHNLSGWRGTRSALLLVLGFGATVFTFFGNLFFSGLHSYSGF